MGLGIGRRRAWAPSGPYLDSQTPATVYSPPATPNPDPRNFQWVSHVEIAPFVVATILYRGCTTFEGLKVLVYKAPLAAIKAQKHLDPHFQESGITPLARFAPTIEGIQAAIRLCQLLQAENCNRPS